MKCRHNLRIRIVITRTSKHHQDIVEGTKSIPDLVYLRVYYIDNIDGCRASYKNESREHFGSISKIANLPQLFSLCLLLCSGLLSFQLCLTRLKLSVSKSAGCIQSCIFWKSKQIQNWGQICNKNLQPKCSRDSFL